MDQQGRHNHRGKRIQESVNLWISHLCRLAALVISLVALATLILDNANMPFVLMGLCLSVALLAIAAMQNDPLSRRREPAERQEPASAHARNGAEEPHGDAGGPDSSLRR